MKPEIKERWLNALRSGEYQQAKGMLRSTNNPQAFCCLGVLCDIYLKKAGEEWTLSEPQAFEDDDDVVGHPVYRCDGQEAVLPESVKTWAGINELDFPLGDRVVAYKPGNYAYLSQLNDDYGYDFLSIAKLIEAQL